MRHSYHKRNEKKNRAEKCRVSQLFFFAWSNLLVARSFSFEIDRRYIDDVKGNSVEMSHEINVAMSTMAN